MARGSTVAWRPGRATSSTRRLGRLNVKGRSKMSKSQLEHAVEGKKR